MTIFNNNINNSRYFAKHNLLNQTSKETPPMTNPKDIAYLLDKNRHKKDPQFRKSSILYWAPLLAALIILYYFF
jgi:hypothetical protein